MADVNFAGLGIALATPFKQDLSIDYESLGNLIDHVIEGGCDYIVAMGTTGETPTLSREEKQELTRYVKDTTARRVPLVIGIGGNNTNRVINNLRERDLEGYSAILSVTPYYNKPTQEGLFQHFKAISEVSPLPIILYNVPARTGVNLTAKTTLRLSQSEKIIGVKEASGDMVQIKEIIKESPAGFQVISGNDGDTTEIMKMGGRGVISVLANALPIHMKNLVELCMSSRWDKAEETQNNLSLLISHLFEDGNPAGVKALLSKIGICENILRLPLVPVCENVERKLMKEFSKIKK